MRYTVRSMIRLSSIKKRLYYIVASYFRFFATLSLRRWKPRVIAVTGSVGKTTLLNLIEIQLGKRAHYSHNANSAFGIPFDIVGLDGIRGSKLRWLYLLIAVPLRSLFFKHTQEFYVVEIDADRPNETRFLASWLKPEVTFWVSVGRSHAVNFETVVSKGMFNSVDEAILHEFSYLPKYTKSLVVYDGDNKQIVSAMNRVAGPAKAAVSQKELQEYAVWPHKTHFVIDGTEFAFAQPMPRETYVQLSCLKELANYIGEPVVADLSDYVQPPGRSNFYEGKKGVKIIDSSYNAHLISMASIIEMLKAMKAKKKWIVVGDIVEQGGDEAKGHAELGKMLKKAKFDRYILVGRRTQHHTYPQLDPTVAVTFLHPKDAAAYLLNEITGQETILFKGSQYLEGVVEKLLAREKDIKTLPRQDTAAKKRRQKWGMV